MVAFMRYAPGADVYVAPVAGGEARRLTNNQRLPRGTVWLDNREVLFASEPIAGHTLWRVLADGKSEAQPLLGVEGNAYFPAIARPAHSPVRIGYQQTTLVVNIWRMEVNIAVEGSPRMVAAPAPVIVSTRGNENPQFSPDASKIVFSSFRSGYPEVWTAAADGSNPAQLTSLHHPRVGSTRWSPDGQRIAFDSLSEGNNDIYVVSADGGTARRLTTEPSNDARPSWSQDGRWIYFRSDRAGTTQIWRIPAVEPYQPATQMTRNGAFEAFESIDGKLLYFIKLGKGLWTMPAEGGEETQVLETVPHGYWGVSDKGIFFVDLSQSAQPLQFFSFGRRKVVTFGAIGKPVIPATPGFAVSRDGRWLAWAQLDRHESDLMLLENFR
jgi:dipeptidyl aminopeptidase/acylaminoacyl peptidase